MSEVKQGSRSSGRIWVVLAALPVVLVMLAQTHWSLDHPYGFCWDEATYINQATIDAQRLESGMLLRLGGSILIKNAGRPPANRILVLPFVVLFGSHTASMRLLSLVGFGLSSFLIFLATRRIAGAAAAALAVLVFALSPEVVWASMWFSTEGPLYVATAAMLYFLLLPWADNTDLRRNWIGLGLAVGLGMLAKASFLAVALPALAFWFAVNRWGGRSVPSLASQLRAVLLAVAVAAPWWAVNIKQVVGFAEGARGFVLHSLGRPGVATWMLWLDTVFQCLLGAGVSLLILLVAMAWFRKAIVKNETTLGPLQKATLRLCACAGLPIVLTQLSGTNHLLRHITPAVIPLAVGVGVLANNSGWDRSKATLAISGVLLGGQLLMFAAPVWFPSDGPVANGFVNCRLPWRVMSRRDQWDWNPLRDLAQSCGLRAPRIAYMGLGPGLSPPQLAYPWAVQGAATRSATIDWPVVEWLWRFGDGPVDWQKVMDQVERSDIVLTLPHYPGVEEEDKLCNEHNDEFVSRLSADPHLQGPIRLQVGRFTPVEVAVFLRKGLVYDFARGASPKSQETNRKLRKDK